MRAELLMAALAFAPLFAASAKDVLPDADWHRCATDADCVLVPGICGEAAVNPAFKDVATKYYSAQPKGSCSAIFWKPKASGARCHLESCEIAIEPAK